MVLLPEEVGEKGLLESRSPTFRIDSSRKDMRRTSFEGPDWEQKAKTRSGYHPGLETSATPADDISCHKKKYLDYPGRETSATPANDIFCHKKKYLDYPGRETSATLANDISCHKKKYLVYLGLETSATPANDNSCHKSYIKTCLQPAERKIECEPIHVVSKPIVSPGHLDGEKYFLEDQTLELLELDLEQNDLPRPEIGNEIQTRRQRRKETGKSTHLENDDDQFILGECVVEIREDFVPSLTGEGTDIGNLIKLSACEIMEAQLRSEESSPLIRGTENGASDEASDQEGASMQFIPVRH
ncbi:uncharacterized protein TNCV_3957761 [Trichonephila clavipes]|nr:uncharacterized protein TNCV_3957761 [Trichonephila clavipes]